MNSEQPDQPEATPSVSSPREPPSGPEPGQQQVAAAKARRDAEVIREVGFPVLMAAANPLGPKIGSSGYKFYRDRLIEDCGTPGDPILRMMIEQLAMAHFRVGQLHVQVEKAQSIEAAKVYSAAAARLTGEVRRLGLAIHRFRQPVSTKHFTVVKQQNLASGDQQVAYVEQQDAATAQGKVPLNDGGSEQASNRLTHARKDHILSEPETSRSRTPEPQETRAADRRRA